VVQVAAFADAQAAADVATKLLSAGFPAYTEASAAGPSGDQRVQRVRIGPFGSREAADAALAKVKAAGYGSAIVSAK
jgi:DedD protein